MSTISSVLDSSTRFDAPAPQAKPGSAMGKDEFLQLLVAQMSNQDPLNPAQGTEYVAQLAQFSSVEQLIQLNNGLMGLGAGQDELLKQIAGGGTSLVSATNLIGRTVEAAGGRAMLEDDKATFDVRLGAPAATGTLTIRDAKGAVVRRINVENLGEGTHQIEWNGRGDKDQVLPDGPYTATFTAASADGKAVQAQAITLGNITRVSTTASGLTAWIGGLAVPVSALSSVSS